jgi:hypothetical protein
MKRSRILVAAALACQLIATIVIATTGSAAAAGNLLVNAGFESGTRFWSQNNSTVVSDNARTGDKAAKLPGGDSSAGMEQVVTGLLPNTTYTLSGYAKTDSQEVWIGVKRFGGAEKNTRLTASTYTLGKVTFTTGATNTSAVVYFYKESTGNTAYGDDFELVPSAALPDDLVVNGGFENGTQAWRVQNASAVGGNAHTGSFAARLLPGESGLQQEISGLSANTTYTLTGYAKTDSMAAWIGVKEYGGPETSTKISTAGYSKGTVTFTTGATDTSAIISFSKASGANTAYGDDFSVVPTPASVPRLWTEGSLASIFKDTLPSPSSGNGITLVSARNEYEFGQIALRSIGAFDITSIVLPDLVSGTNRIPSGSLRYNFVDHLYLGHNSSGTNNPIRRAPGFFPEYLLNERSRSVPGHTTQAISVTAYVPKNTPAGMYTGTVTVNTSAGNHTVGMSVEVADVTVPDSAEAALSYANYTTLFGFEGTIDQTPIFYPGMVKYSPEWWALMKKFAADMKEHRMNTHWIPTVDLLVDGGTTVAKNGRVTFKWSRFDEVVQMLTDAGAVKRLLGDNFLLKEPDDTYRIWGLKHTNGSTVKQKLPFDSREGQSFARQYLTALKAHLESKGWLDRWTLSVGDEPWSANHYSTIRRAIDELIDVYAPGMKTSSPHFTSPKASPGTYEGRLDVYVPLLDRYEAERDYYRDRQAAGDEVWTYIAIVPQGDHYNRFIDLPLARLRFMNWYNFANGVTGTLHWAYSNWKETAATWPTPGDTSIVYPDPVNDTLKSTLRNDTMRDGAEEYELLAILAEKNPTLAAKLASAVAPTAANPSRNNGYLADKHDQLVRAAAGQAVADRPVTAFNKVQAENFSSQDGVCRENTSDIDGEQHVCGASNGDAISYDSIDFGPGGPTRLDLRTAAAVGGASVEVRLDGTSGPPVATVPIATGGWQTNRVALTVPAGIHAVHLRFVGPGDGVLMQVNWLKFTRLSGNLAREATATASSEYSAQYGAARVNDDIASEWDAGEWASQGELNPWVQLTWKGPQAIRQVILFDRPGPDSAKSGTLVLSDGTRIPVADIPDNGDGLAVTLPGKSVRWVRFQVTGGTGVNVGLSELQAF